MPELDHHFEQGRPYTCIAACWRMLRSQRGRADISEGELHGRCGVSPDSPLAFPFLVNHRQELDLSYSKFPFGEPEALYMLAPLIQERWAMVEVLGPVLTYRVHTTNSPSVSRHGAMVAGDVTDPSLLDQATPLHAIVLTDITTTSVRFLDPYYASNGQPFTLTHEEFLDLWNYFAVQCR